MTEQEKRDMADDLLQFVNYHDGGYIEGYVAMKIADYVEDKVNTALKNLTKEQIEKILGREIVIVKTLEDMEDE